MLKKFRHSIATTATIAFSLYLGFAFWDLVLSTFLPQFLEVGGVLASSFGFNLVMNWLREETPQFGYPTEENDQRVRPVPTAQLLHVRKLENFTSQTATQLKVCARQNGCHSPHHKLS